MQKKKGFKMPTAFTILFLIIIVLAIITQFVGGKVIPATLPDVVMAAPRGLVGYAGKGFDVGGAIDVSFFVMVLGGFLGVVTRTKALEAGVATVVKKLKGKEIYMIPVLMLLFSVGGTTYGMAEETIGFYALIVSTMMAAGFDAITGTSIILLGAGVGVLGSTINPFAVGVAVDAVQASVKGLVVNQSIVIALGCILWLSSYAISVIFVMRYAKKVKLDKSKSIMTDEETAEAIAAFANDEEEEPEFTGKRKAVMCLFAFTFIVMILSLLPWWAFNITIFNGWTSFLTGLSFGDWYFQELQAWFFIMAIVVGLVYRLKETEIVNSFMAGVGDMVGVALVVAVSRGITVIMASTGLQTYILNAAATALQGINSGLFASMSYLIYIGLSFLIPSTSGLANGSLPVFGPLTVKLGLSPEVMIMIFSAGSGIVNLITPTSGVVMGGLATSHVGWGTWIKFVSKILLCIFITSIVVLSVAMMIL
ncbi:MAG: YfcC family protein [Erysipelotrichaceae bacterium]